MEHSFFKQPFTDKGIEIAVPPYEDRQLVNESIAKELEFGIVKEAKRAELIVVIERMKTQEGIEAVILGCTEFPIEKLVEFVTE